MAVKGFSFNGTHSGAYGLFVNNVNNYGSAARNVEKISVPYRNGDIAIDYGTFQNYYVTYDVMLYKNTASNIEAIAAWLLGASGYCTLIDDWDTTVMRSATYYNQIDWTVTQLTRYGKASITFDCKPQKYIVPLESYMITSDTTLTNSTLFDARPLITVYGNGTFTVNGYEITVTDNSSSYIKIDSETLQCYRGSTNMNNSVTLSDFPVLTPGSNSVTIGTVSYYRIEPRWWRI